MRQTVPCPTCGGKGRREQKVNVFPVFCERCNGTGKAPAVFGANGELAAVPWTDPHPELGG